MSIILAWAPLAMLVFNHFVCILHWKRNRYVSRVSGGRKCEACAERLRIAGEPAGFHEQWIAENWRRL